MAAVSCGRAVARVVGHLAVDDDRHAFVHAADVAGDDHIGAARVDLEHRIAGLGVFKNNVLDHALQLEQFALHAAASFPPFFAGVYLINLNQKRPKLK